MGHKLLVPSAVILPRTLDLRCVDVIFYLCMEQDAGFEPLKDCHAVLTAGRQLLFLYCLNLSVGNMIMP